MSTLMKRSPALLHLLYLKIIKAVDRCSFNPELYYHSNLCSSGMLTCEVVTWIAISQVGQRGGRWFSWWQRRRCIRRSRTFRRSWWPHWGRWRSSGTSWCSHPDASRCSLWIRRSSRLLQKKIGYDCQCQVLVLV